MEHPGETTEAAHLGWIYLLILHFFMVFCISWNCSSYG